MTKGRGSTLRVRQRRDKILAALAAAEHPLTTREITVAIGMSVGRYSTVYADLRTLCGSTVIPYAEHVGAVNADGYPVVWLSWGTDGAQATRWDLTEDARAAAAAEVHALEAAFAAPSGQDAP